MIREGSTVLNGVFADLPANARRLLLLLFALACATVAIAGIRSVAGLLNPVLAAGFLALLLHPLLQKLRRPFGSAAAAVVALIVVIAGLAIVAFVAASLRQVALQMPRYQHQLQDVVSLVTGLLGQRGIDSTAYLQSALSGPTAARIVMNISGSIGGVIRDLLLTYMIFVFALGTMADIEEPGSKNARSSGLLAARALTFARTLRTYVAARTVLGLAAAVLDYIILLAVGVEYALLWAVLSFVLSFVPNIGFALSMLPPVLLALLSRGPSSAAIVVAGYVAVNVVLDNVIGPRYVGNQLQISALLSFLSVLLWTWLIGPLGAIFAVPLTLLVRDLALAPPENRAR